MITIKQKLVFTRGARGRRRIADGPPPSQKLPEGRTPRISRLLALALHFDDLLRTGKISDMSELARLAMVTQPRVTQVMNLCLLAPDIQEEILFLPRITRGRDPIHEKRLRTICTVQCFDRQRRMWEVVKRTMASK